MVRGGGERGRGSDEIKEVTEAIRASIHILNKKKRLPLKAKKFSFCYFN